MSDYTKHTRSFDGKFLAIHYQQILNDIVDNAFWQVLHLFVIRLIVVRIIRSSCMLLIVIKVIKPNVINLSRQIV